MWQPSAVNGRSISNSKHDNPADLTRYANASQSTPQPLALLAQGPAADELINLSSMHVSEAPPRTPEAFINGTLPPAAFGILPENTSLNFMAHLQQYLRQRYRSSTKTPGLPSPWPLQPPPPSPFGGTANSSSVSSAAATASNGHLLLSPEGLAASNVMMSSTRPPPPPPTFFGDAATHSNSASSTSLGSPASNSAPVFYMSPLDIFTDTFIRLNALHLSTSNNSSTAATHSHSIQQVLQPINSNTSTMSTAATTEVNNGYGSATANATATMARVAAAAAAAAMVSFGGGVSPLAVLPPPPLLPPQLLPHQHLFKPYFHMDETQYQQHLEKSTALKKSTTTATAAATLSTSSLEASLHHNNASKATTTAAAASSTTKRSSLSTSNTSPTSPINCDLKRASRKRSVDLLLSQQPRNSSKYHHQLRGGDGVIIANSTNSDDVHDEEDDDDESLLPPPKKKWIRHYLNEDESNVASNTTSTTSYLLVSNSAKVRELVPNAGNTTTITSINPNITFPSNRTTSDTRIVVAQQQHQQREHDEPCEDMLVDEEHQPQASTPQTSPQKPTSILQTATKFTLIDSNGEIIGNAAATGPNALARQQMLLTNGIRIVTPVTAAAAAVGLQQNKTISIPLNGKNVPIITGLPYQLAHPTAQQSQQHTLNNSGGVGAGGGGRNKQFTPLTPPPMSSRKFVEPSQYRIRSFSLSSHKISANHQMHVQNSNGNSSSNSSSTPSNNSMMVDDIPPTQQHTVGYATSSAAAISNSQQHSPPRQGNHYMHMINAATSQQAGSAGGNPHVSHVTPRRRTISSTSNGAGTREVHNKLEKNRRAHLKECYEALKNQLSLKDEDRRKTSNLAILGEALKCVQTFQKHNQELEAEWEHLANDKINLQKRILNLKRELGPKYEQIFSGIFPDIEVGSIPSERDTINDTHSLSSGRGSVLYSSSSSLSSGGSNGSNSNGSSNAMSSPVGAGLQTAMPTAISPVITKINSTHNNSIGISNSNSSTSPISINSNNLVLQQQRKHPATTITTTIQAVAIPTQVVAGLGGGLIAANGGGNSPTTAGSTMPLSLTAKNISATAITRGSPTPSTPSPSPSSSSGVSSSSSLISSSPPINGVINSNGRNVTVNIPNGLKLQAATAGNGIAGSVTAHAIAGTIGNGATSAAATIIATSAPAQGVNNTNNAAVPANHHLKSQHQPQQFSGGRKKSNHSVVENSLSNKNHQHQQQHQHQSSSEDGEQPAKFLKVFNCSSPTAANGIGGGAGGGGIALHENFAANVVVAGQKVILTNNLVAGGGCGNVVNTNLTLANGKMLTNGSSATTTVTTITGNELCRLPGGAELNILPPTSSSCNTLNTVTSVTNGHKIGGPTTTTTATSTALATAFYHANGKITFVGPPQMNGNSSSSSLSASVSSVPHGTATVTANGILLKDASSMAATTNGSTSLTPSTSAASPLISTTNINGLHFTGNFAQLLAAANSNTTTLSTSNGGSANASNNYANISAIESSPSKVNSKPSIVAWRTGAATTN